MIEQQLARLGGHGAAAVAHQQVLPQLDFEQAHLAAERGLRHVELHRGTREAAQFGDADEILELLEVHGFQRPGVPAGIPPRQLCRSAIAASGTLPFCCGPLRKTMRP